jgi:hypothetical protein
MSVPVTGVTVAPTLELLVAGATLQLIATVEPEDATDPSVTWESDNEDYATVDSDGLVTALQEGGANITVQTVDGDFTASCEIAVNSDGQGAIYGEMLDYFPEDFISVMAFDQEPLLNNGWADPTNREVLSVIIQDGKTETKDANGNIVQENHQFLWSPEEISQGFVVWQGRSYRLTFVSDWPRTGGFFAYEMDKLVGTDNANNTNPEFDIGGVVT